MYVSNITRNKEVVRKNLCEALEIWSSLRKKSNEMYELYSELRADHSRLPGDFEIPDREIKLKKFYNEAADTIGNEALKYLTEIIKELSERKER